MAKATPALKPTEWTPVRIGITALSVLVLCYLALPPLGILVRVAATPESLTELDLQPVFQALGLSLVTTFISLMITILAGTPLAYAIARYPLPFKPVLNTLIELPIVMPPVVAGLGLLVAFGRRGLIGQYLTVLGISLPFTIMAVIMAQVFVSAPFYMRSAQVQFASISRDLEEAARIDGANDWQLFRDVTIPLSARGLIAGMLLSWARSLGEFGATILFAGSLAGRTRTMTLLVYAILESDLNAALWSASILLVGATLALLGARWVMGEESPPPEL